MIQAAGLPGLKAPVSFRRAAMAGAPATRGVKVQASMSGKSFDSNWLNKNPLVPAVSFLGWTIPSSIPTGALGGNSLFGLLTSSIGENLARFPTGPSLDDKFWLYLLTWHIGLFTTMLLGQVGVNGRKQGYW